MAIETPKLSKILQQLRQFNIMDNKMQISTILCLLEIAKADSDKREVSVGDIGNKLGLHSGTASRNVNYWADGAKDMTGAHGMVKVDFHSQDRRLRRLTLTPKGRAFIKTILGEDT